MITKKAKIKYVGGHPSASWKVVNMKGICILRGSWDKCKAKLTILESSSEVEHGPVKPEVVGSIPTFPAKN